MDGLLVLNTKSRGDRLQTCVASRRGYTKLLILNTRSSEGGLQT